MKEAFGAHGLEAFDGSQHHVFLPTMSFVEDGNINQKLEFARALPRSTCVRSSIDIDKLRNMGWKRTLARTYCTFEQYLEGQGQRQKIP